MTLINRKMLRSSCSSKELDLWDYRRLKSKHKIYHE